MSGLSPEAREALEWLADRLFWSEEEMIERIGRLIANELHYSESTDTGEGESEETGPQEPAEAEVLLRHVAEERDQLLAEVSRLREEPKAATMPQLGEPCGHFEAPCGCLNAPDIEQGYDYWRSQALRLREQLAAAGKLLEKWGERVERLRPDGSDWEGGLQAEWRRGVAAGTKDCRNELADALGLLGGEQQHGE